VELGGGPGRTRTSNQTVMSGEADVLSPTQAGCFMASGGIETKDGTLT
jgi:hypothetical protein